MNKEKCFDNSLIGYLLHPSSDKQSNLIALQIKQIIDEMPGGFFIYRAGGDEEIIYANKAMYRIFNCSTKEEFQELTHNSFRGVVHPDDLEDVEKSIKEQIRSSQNNLDYVEYRIIQKGGKIRWVDDYGHLVHTENEGDFFYVFIGEKPKHIEEMEEIVSQNKKKEQALKNQIETYNKEMERINQNSLSILR